MSKRSSNPVNKTTKINTRQAVEHVVRLLCKQTPGHEEFASNLLDFLPDGSLTLDEEQAIRDEYDIHRD
jgi:hypothetical protein